MAESDFFEISDHEALAILDSGDVVTGFEETGLGTGIEPGHAAGEDTDVELIAEEVLAIDVGDFEFAAGAGLEMAADIDDLRIVDVEAGDGELAFGVGRFFFEGEGLASGGEFDDAVAFGIFDLVAEDAGTGGGFDEVEGLAKEVEFSVEDVVTEDQGDGILADEFFADEEGLGDASGAGLFGVFEVDTEGGAIAEEVLELG